jgi:hypothetical protein
MIIDHAEKEFNILIKKNLTRTFAHYREKQKDRMFQSLNCLE